MLGAGGQQHTEAPRSPSPPSAPHNPGCLRCPHTPGYHPPNTEGAPQHLSTAHRPFLVRCPPPSSPDVGDEGLDVPLQHGDHVGDDEGGRGPGDEQSGDESHAGHEAQHRPRLPCPGGHRGESTPEPHTHTRTRGHPQGSRGTLTHLRPVPSVLPHACFSPAGQRRGAAAFPQRRRGSPAPFPAAFPSLSLLLSAAPLRQRPWGRRELRPDGG